MQNKFKKTVLVTGGLGFIGSNLIIKLLKLNYKVINIDAILYPSIKKKFLHEKNQYVFHKVNIKNYKKIKKIIFENNPSIIFHLAAESHVDRSISNPSQFIQSNILGTYNLLECTREFLKKNKSHFLKFIHISTDEVYGSISGDYKFKESSKYFPNSPYSASKASSDHLVYAWHKTFNMPIIITHCANNYGPYQFPEKLIPLTINKAINLKKIPIYGNGKNIRNWIYVEDHVDALIALSNKGVIGNTYNIGAEKILTNIQLVKKICALLDNKISNKYKYKKLIKFVKDRPGHDFKYDIDSTKIKKEINWSPNISIDKGLDITINWYLNNQKWLDKISKKLKLNYK